MTRVISSIAMSLDGYAAGPDPSMTDPLGRGGEQLHRWAFALRAWREPHGLEGGGESPSAAVIREQVDATGAVVMGRRMFSGGAGPWEDDANAGGWWGDDPPFHVPVFVLTHHDREPLALQGGTTFRFVTDGVQAAVERARAAAGDRDVHVAGGAEAIQQCLGAGLLDELEVHLVPVLLRAGRRLFEHHGDARLEQDRVIGAPGVAHLRYRVIR